MTKLSGGVKADYWFTDSEEGVSDEIVFLVGLVKLMILSCLYNVVSVLSREGQDRDGGYVCTLLLHYSGQIHCVNNERT